MRRIWMLFAAVVLSVFFAALSCDRKDSNAAPGTSEPGVAEPAKAADKAGMALAGADKVAIADLFADPAKYEGKVVRLEGKVGDFCKHARAWFAIADAEGKRMVRVMAKPRFEAPADCIGRKAVTEGKVSLQTLSDEQVQYFLKGDHKFLSPEQVKPGEPVRIPVIEAFGAEFE
jgi:hypothetical protein